MKIANDIAEDIHNPEAVCDLRMAVAYWADVAAVEAGRRADLEAKLALLRSAKDIMDTVLGENVLVRHVISARARRGNVVG